MGLSGHHPADQQAEGDPEENPSTALEDMEEWDGMWTISRSTSFCISRALSSTRTLFDPLFKLQANYN